MAICPYCDKETPLKEENPPSFQCSHCEKIVRLEQNSKKQQELQKNEENDEEDEDEDEEENDEYEDDDDEDDDDDDDQHSKKRIMALVLAVLGAVGLFFAFAPEKSPEEVPLPTIQEESVSADPVEEVAPFVKQSLSLILPPEGVFGESVQWVTQENPNLFAMNSQGNHYGNFENGLTLPLDPPVAVGNIFYYFDQALTLKNLEFQLRTQGDLFLEEEAEEIVEALSAWYLLGERGADWYLWEASDGFVGFHQTLKFIYVSRERENVVGVLS